MSTEQQIDYGEVVTVIQGLLTTHAAFLGESTVEGVSHYLEHDEFGDLFGKHKGATGKAVPWSELGGR